MSRSFAEQEQTLFQPPTTDGQTPDTELIDTASAGSIKAAATYDQNGYQVATQAALATVTAVADAARKSAPTLTIGFAAKTTVAVGLANPNGGSSFVYTRPDGSLGRIDFGTVNQVA